MNTKENIERLAEINMAGSMVALGDDLREERKTIFHELLETGVVVKLENGAFDFIGENSEEHKGWYMDAFVNF
jgi:hypothetical protein